MRSLCEDELDQLAEELDRDGVCVVRNLFEPALIQSWAAAFTELFLQRQAQPGGREWFQGRERAWWPPRKLSSLAK
jgi:hypothetical protein